MLCGRVLSLRVIAAMVISAGGEEAVERGGVCQNVLAERGRVEKNLDAG